jgi:hypothetical protein
MKTTSRVTWVTLALLAGLALAAFTALAATDSGNTTNERFNDLRSVMYYGVFTAKPVDKGIEVTLTSTDATVVKAIRAEFSGERHPVRTTIPDTTLQAKLLDSGAVLTFRSDNARQAESLKSAGVYAAYDTLRSEISNLVWAEGGPGPGFRRGFGRHMGPGWGWGPDHGPGYGPGRMGRGYGPGPGVGPGDW